MRPTLSPNPPSPLYRPSNPPHRSHAPARAALLRTAWVCLCLHAQPNLNLVNLQPVSFRVFPRRAPNPPAMCANAAWQCHGPLRPRRQPYIRVSIPHPAHRVCAPPAHACTAPHSQLPTALRPHHLLREVLPRRVHSGRAAAAHNRAVGSTPAPLATRPHEQATNRAGGARPPRTDSSRR